MIFFIHVIQLQTPLCSPVPASLMQAARSKFLHKMHKALSFFIAHLQMCLDADIVIQPGVRSHLGQAL